MSDADFSLGLHNPEHDQAHTLDHLNGHHDDAAAYAQHAEHTDVQYDFQPTADDEPVDLSGVPPVTVPKPIDFGMSYAHAHHAAKPVSMAPQGVKRAPQALPQPKKPVVEAKQEAQGPAKPKLAAGKALVKSVLSGDTLVLQGSAPVGSVAPEKVIQLSGISAPRLGRGKSTKDEPYAWESREYLRNLVIGKVVQFAVNYAHESSGREYAVVKLDDKNLSEYMVSAGLARTKAGTQKKDGKVHPDRQALVDIEAQAEAAGLGVHNKESKPDSHVRRVDWNPDPRALFSASKGLAVPGIVDYVRDGSTLRVELLSNPAKPDQKDSHTMITLFLAGIQAPRIPLPPQSARKSENDRKGGNKAKRSSDDDESDEEEEKPVAKQPQQPAQPPPPFALAAKDFVEQRLLHRDVGVIILGVDKAGNIFGSIVFHKGNIAVELLKSGLTNLVEWSAALSPDAAQMHEAANYAKENRLNLHRDHVPQAKHAEHKSTSEFGTIHDDQYQAKVVQIVSGDTMVVQDNEGGQKRIMLASIIAPRLPNKNRNDKGEDWANEAKEFMRKKLIGRKVKVVSEYSRSSQPQQQQQQQQQGNQQQRSGEDRHYVSVYHNKSNVSEPLVAAGFAKVVVHRMEEARASNYEALLAAEEQAKSKKLGIYGTQKPPVHNITDLSERFGRSGPRDKAAEDDKKADENTPAKLLSAKAKQFLTFLSKDSYLTATVEYVFSGSRLKLLVPKHNVIVAFVLAGVRVPQPPAQNAARKDVKSEPFGKEAVEYTRNLIMQTDVKIEVETLDRGDNFIGSVFINKDNLAVLLLKEGLASVYGPSADRSKYSKDLYAAEEEAKAAKKNMWANWTPPAPKPVEEKQEEEVKELTESEKFISVEVTEVVDCATFYVHVVGNNAIQFVQDAMTKFGEAVDNELVPKSSNWAPEKNATVAGRFNDGQWYRVKIDSKTAGGDYRVKFIDFGNSEVLESSELRPITDRAIMNVEPLAKMCVLAGIKAPSATSEYAPMALQAFEDLAFGRPLMAKIQLHERDKLHVTLHDTESPDSVNQVLLREGLVRVQTRPDRRLRKLADELRSAEEEAKHSRVNIWEYGNVSDDEEEDVNAMRGGAGRGAPRGKPTDGKPVKRGP